MRIARLDHNGVPRTAVITRDDRVQLLPAEVGVLDVLGAPPAQRDEIAAGAEAALPLSEIRLLAPIEPPSIRDFSVFEAHIEGIVMGEGRKVPERWYEGPFCYFSQSARDHRPGRRDRDPAGVGAPRPRARGGGDHRTRGPQPHRRGRGCPHRRLHDLQRLVGA